MQSIRSETLPPLKLLSRKSLKVPFIHLKFVKVLRVWFAIFLKKIF